jgi:hypothetical protein
MIARDLIAINKAEAANGNEFSGWCRATCNNSGLGPS